MFIFFTCIKKTNQKKVQPITWSRITGLPCAACKERATSESRTPSQGYSAESLIRSLLCCSAAWKGKKIKFSGCEPILYRWVSQLLPEQDGKTVWVRCMRASFLPSRQQRETQGSPKGRHSWSALFVFLFGLEKIYRLSNNVLENLIVDNSWHQTKNYTW